MVMTPGSIGALSAPLPVWDKPESIMFVLSIFFYHQSSIKNKLSGDSHKGIRVIRDSVNYISSPKEGIKSCPAYGQQQGMNPAQNQN